MLLTVFIIAFFSILYSYIFIKNLPIAVFILFVSGLIESLIQIYLNLPIIELQSNFFLSLGELHIYAGDIYFLSFTLSFVILIQRRLKLNQDIPNQIKLLSIYFLIIIFNVFIGWMIYKTLAIVHSRGILLTLAIIFALGIRPISLSEVKNTFKSIFIISLFYIVIVFLRDFDIINVSTALTSIGLGTWRSQRVIDRSEAVFLVFSLLMTLNIIINSEEKNKFIDISVILLLLYSIFRSGIRSIWVISIFVIICVFFIKRNISTMRLIKVIVLIFILSFAFQNIISTQIIQEYFLDAAYSAIRYDDESTFYWRNLVNISYILHMNIPNYLFGSYFGETPTLINTTMPAAGLHNNYIEVLFYGGIFSFVIFYAVYIKVIYKLTKLLAYIDMNNKIVIMNIAFMLSAYLLFYLSWTIDILNSILLGIAISTLNSKEELQNENFINQ